MICPLEISPTGCAALPMPINLTVDMTNRDRSIQWEAGPNPTGCAAEVKYVVICTQEEVQSKKKQKTGAGARLQTACLCA